MNVFEFTHDSQAMLAGGLGILARSYAYRSNYVDL